MTARGIRLSTALGLLVLGLVLAPAAPARTVTETASNGGLTAEMTYKASGPFGASDVRIAIIRNGAVLLDRKPQPTCNFCEVLPGGSDGGPVHALQLDASPEPEAVFDLYSGGAHCCFYSLIYRYEATTNSYVGLEHDWFNAGYRFIDPEGDGRFEFLTRDDRFAYAFASYAFSRYPPQVWRYEGDRMVDATRQYPSIVRRAAASERRRYRRLKGRGDVRATLAAYVADRCLLGDCSAGFSLVRAALRHGYLEKQGAGIGPTGAKFVRRLRAFLRRTGYL